MEVINKFKRFISLFTDKKIFINRDIDIHNNSSIINKERVNSLSPKYKLQENVGSFELYGTIRDKSNIAKYKLIHTETKTTIYVTEKVFRLLFKRE